MIRYLITERKGKVAIKRKLQWFGWYKLICTAPDLDKAIKVCKAGKKAFKLKISKSLLAKELGV